MLLHKRWRRCLWLAQIFNFGTATLISLQLGRCLTACNSGSSQTFTRYRIFTQGSQAVPGGVSSFQLTFSRRNIGFHFSHGSRNRGINIGTGKLIRRNTGRNIRCRNGMQGHQQLPFFNQITQAHMTLFNTCCNGGRNLDCFILV